MTEQFKLKKGWIVIFLIIPSVSLLACVGFTYAYFFDDDEAIYIFLALLSGIGGIGLFFTNDMRNHFIEVSEKGLVTYKNRINFSWEQVRLIENIKENIVIHYENEEGQAKSVKIGPIIDGYDYLAILVRKYTSERTGQNG